MGKFVIAEATRTLTVIQLKAYDYMLRFDKNLVSSGSARTPYEWLKYACEACKVTLGITEEDVFAPEFQGPFCNGSAENAVPAKEDLENYYFE